MHCGHQLQLVVQLDAVVAGQSSAEGLQRPLAHDPIHGSGFAPKDSHCLLRLLQAVLQLVLRGHGVEKSIGAQRDLPSDADLHDIQVVTQLEGRVGEEKSKQTSKTIGLFISEFFKKLKKDVL